MSSCIKNLLTLCELCCQDKFTLDKNSFSLTLLKGINVFAYLAAAILPLLF